MWQEILVLVLFVGAIGYVGSLFWKSINKDGSCHSSCNCDPRETKRLQNQIIRHHKNKTFN